MIVVGAGIVGAVCAAELAARGLSVEVIDARGIGSGTTAAGMGHIVVVNDPPAEFALSRLFARVVARTRAARIVDQRELREQKPSLSHAMQGGLLIPDDAIVYAPCAAH